MIVRVWRGESVEDMKCGGYGSGRVCVHLLWAAEILKGQGTEQL